MKANFERGTKPGEDSHPIATGALSEQAIKRQLRTDAALHPAALLPLAVSIMAVIYLLVLSPVFGGRPWAIVLAVVSGAVAAAAFTWRYAFRYTEEYARQSGDLLVRMDEERERLERAEATRLLETLHSGFMSVGSAQGLKALGELAAEYQELASVLVRNSDADPLSITRLPILADETYRRGLSVLSDALELMKAADTSVRGRVQSEIAELEREIETSKGEATLAERSRLKEETLASHLQRLEMLDRLRLRVYQLLYQAFRCEAALQGTRIELAAVRTGSSQTSVDSVIDALERTMRQAQEVQEELKRIGY